MKLRAMTIRQPWAGLIVGTFKKSHALYRHGEVRSWETSWRGTLLIHAGLAVDRDACKRFGIDTDMLVRGALVGHALLENIMHVDTEEAWDRLRPVHRESGARGYGESTCLWLLQNAVAFKKPIYCKGRLGLWIPPRDIVAQLPLR